MRRALVLVSVSVAALLGTTLAAASAAAPAPRAQMETEREVRLAEFHVGGFGVNLWVTNNDGEVTAMLIVSRGGLVAYYLTPAKVTAERVKAQFGTLGELDYRFHAVPGESTRCLGAQEYEDEAVFEGTFTFTGESEYVHFDVDHAEGGVHVEPAPKGCAQPGRARRVVPYSPSYSTNGATLGAKAGSKGEGQIREVRVYDDGPGGQRRVRIFATLAELREGMTVARGVEMAAPAGAFGWNLMAGTASLRPPAPFAGSAKFTRHGHIGQGTWIGSLTMPILGGEPVRMAGGSFRAFIHKGTPQDE